MRTLLLLLLLSLPSWAQVTLVNAGGSVYSAGGVTWSASTGFTDGTSFTGNTTDIDDTGDDTLYTTGVQAASSFQWQTTITPGFYRVRLLFAETQDSIRGQRRFNITLNGAVIASNLDVFDRAGAAATAYQLNTHAALAGTTLSLAFNTVSGSPFVNAIHVELLSALSSGDTTPAECTVGQLFFDTDATAGQNLYACTAADTWTVQTGSASIGADEVGTAELDDGADTPSAGQVVIVAADELEFEYIDQSALAAGTAAALASNPADCSANQYANAIDAAGDLTCAGVTGAQVANTPAGNIAATTVQTAIDELDSEKTTVAAVQSGAALVVTGGSGTDAYTGSATPTLAACVDGLVIKFLPDVANTGAATLDVDGCGPLDIYQNADETDLDDNDLLPTVPVLLSYCPACNTAAGAWILHGVVGFGAAQDFASLLNAKENLLSGQGTFNFSNSLSGTVQVNLNTTGTAPVLLATPNLLSLNVPFEAPSFTSTDTSNPGVVSFCETGATPSCITLEAPASLTNPLGFTFGDTQPPAAGSVIELGAVAANKTAVTYRQLFSSGIILPALLPAATTTAQGAAELATTAETTTGTDAGRVVTPDGLSGSVYGRKTLIVEVFPVGTVCSTGDKKRMFPIPVDLNGMNLVAVDGRVDLAGTTGTLNLDIARCPSVATGNQCQTEVDVLSTNLTIDTGENKSSTAAAAAVIDTANDDVATDQMYRLDIDACHTTPSTALWLALTFQTP